MSAFTKEQQAVLREAFHHVWSRMGALHDDLNEESLRLVSAIATLAERGLLTREEVERIAMQIHVEASLRVHLSADRVIEGAITAAILDGDLEAFHRRQAEEED
jgi:hypothetical protein